MLKLCKWIYQLGYERGKRDTIDKVRQDRQFLESMKKLKEVNHE